MRNEFCLNGGRFYPQVQIENFCVSLPENTKHDQAYWLEYK